MTFNYVSAIVIIYSLHRLTFTVSIKILILNSLETEREHKRFTEQFLKLITYKSFFRNKSDKILFDLNIRQTLCLNDKNYITEKINILSPTFCNVIRTHCVNFPYASTLGHGYTFNII